MPPTPTLNPNAHSRRDEAFFDATLRTRVMIREVADRVFFRGNGGHVLKRYCDAGQLVADARAYPGNVTGYRPTIKTCTTHGVSKDRARALRGSALDCALGLLVFCHLEKHPRYPLYHQETKEILGKAAPATTIPHLVSSELGKPAIFRVYQAANVHIHQAIETVWKRVDEAKRHPGLGAWCEAGQYGVAILASTSKRLEALEREVSRSGLDKRAALILGLGPTVETLHPTLVELRKSKTS
jgi:hypothetical protein